MQLSIACQIVFFCIRAELRKSKQLISGPVDFCHVGHIGPEQKVNVVQDRLAAFCHKHG